VPVVGDKAEAGVWSAAAVELETGAIEGAGLGSVPGGDGGGMSEEDEAGAAAAADGGVDVDVETLVPSTGLAFEPTQKSVYTHTKTRSLPPPSCSFTPSSFACIFVPVPRPSKSGILNVNLLVEGLRDDRRGRGSEEASSASDAVIVELGTTPALDSGFFPDTTSFGTTSSREEGTETAAGDFAVVDKDRGGGAGAVEGRAGDVDAECEGEGDEENQYRLGAGIICGGGGGGVGSGSVIRGVSVGTDSGFDDASRSNTPASLDRILSDESFTLTSTFILIAAALSFPFWRDNDPNHEVVGLIETFGVGFSFWAVSSVQGNGIKEGSEALAAMTDAMGIRAGS
jgi:hypothetical protein